ncbi:MAG: hypothetical protein KAT31_05465, partial [Bacteroidales bacterium]|nr:hypothetical protein [Bacteroidales bacterium]
LPYTGELTGFLLFSRVITSSPELFPFPGTFHQTPQILPAGPLKHYPLITITPLPFSHHPVE